MLNTVDCVYFYKYAHYVNKTRFILIFYSWYSNILLLQTQVLVTYCDLNFLFCVLSFFSSLCYFL